jgi:hypothetical protein
MISVENLRRPGPTSAIARAKSPIMNWTFKLASRKSCWLRLVDPAVRKRAVALAQGSLKNFSKSPYPLEKCLRISLRSDNPTSNPSSDEYPSISPGRPSQRYLVRNGMGKIISAPAADQYASSLEGRQVTPLHWHWWLERS